MEPRNKKAPEVPDRGLVPIFPSNTPAYWHTLSLLIRNSVLQLLLLHIFLYIPNRWKERSLKRRTVADSPHFSSSRRKTECVLLVGNEPQEALQRANVNPVYGAEFLSVSRQFGIEQRLEVK